MAETKKPVRKKGDIEQKKYVLYNISHYGYLTTVLLHKHVFHKHDYGVLIAENSWFSGQTKEFINSKNSVPFFDEFYAYSGATRKNDTGEDILENDIVSMFNDLFEKCKYGFDKYSHIYTGFDGIHAFGVYLSIKEKRYTVFDLLAITSRSDKTYLDKKLPYYNLLVRHKALTGRNPLIDGIIYTAADSFEGIKEITEKNNISDVFRPLPDIKNVSFFTPNNAKKKLGTEAVRELSDFFDFSFDGKTEYTVLFTTSQVFFGTTNLVEEFKGLMKESDIFLFPFKVLIDYFYAGDHTELIVKLHPNAPVNKEKIEKNLRSIKTIPGYAPSELLDVLNLNVSSAISCGSNAIFTYETKKTLPFPRSYFNYFRRLYSLHLSLSLAKFLGNATLFIDLDAPEALSELLISNIFVDDKNIDNRVEDYNLAQCVIIDVTGKNIEDIMNTYSNNEIKILFGVPNQYGNLPKGSSVIRLEKERESSPAVCDLDDEYVYVITDDERVSELLNTFSYSKNLRTCRLTTRAHKIETYEHVLHTRNSGENIKHVDSVLEAAEAGNEYSQYIISKRYEKGEGGFDADMDSAITWMKRASETNDDYVFDYVDLLMKKSSEDSMTLAFSTCEKALKENPTPTYLRLARMYRDGKGTKKDVDKAIEFMRIASNNGNRWAKNELFDMLWKRNGEEDLKEAYEVAFKHSSDGDAGANGRLARAYRDGKGVSEDLDKAIRHMRIAAGKDIKWAKNELFDMLWQRNGEEDLKEAYDTIFDYSKGGDGSVLGRLARAYRDGKGVKKDTGKAIQLMRQAMDKNVKWAKNELIDLLQLCGSEKDLKEVATLTSNKKKIN